MDDRTDSRRFRDAGLIRRFSVLLIRLGRVIDALITFAVLYFTVRWFGEAWRMSLAGIGLLFVLIFQVITSLSRTYRSRRVVRLRHHLLSLFVSWNMSAAIVISSIVILNGADPLLGRIVVVWLAVSLAIVAAWNVGVRIFLRYARYYGFDARRVGFVGANEMAAKLEKVFEKYPWAGMNVVGVFDDRVATHERVLAYPASKVAGSSSDLIELARRGAVDIVYITLPMAAEKRIKGFVDTFAETTASIYYCPSVYSFDLMNTRSDDVFGQPVISVIESPFTGNSRVLKRLEDWVLLLLLGPFVAVLATAIAIAICATSHGPVLFRQSRHGLDGRKFLICKFRTMYVDQCSEAFSQVRRNDLRVTPLGRILRATSLDELPQFFNVLMGDMSIVGPRPHPDTMNEDLRKQIYRYMIRHKVRPGITGLAQVSGFRGETDTNDKMEKRIACDLEYIRNWSIWLDMTILFRTVMAIRGKHVY